MSAQEVFSSSERYFSQSSELYSSGNMLGFDLDGDENLIFVYKDINDILMLSVNNNRSTTNQIKYVPISLLGTEQRHKFTVPELTARINELLKEA